MYFLCHREIIHKSYKYLIATLQYSIQGLFLMFYSKNKLPHITGKVFTLAKTLHTAA